MRWRHMTHTTEDWHNSPLPKGSSRALTVPSGRGVGALEAPQDRHKQEHRTGTSRAEQTDRDHGGAGNSGSHGGAGSSEGLGGAGSSGDHGGAGSSGDHGGAGSSGDHGGAGSSGDHGGAGSSGGHGRWSLGPLASTPSARPLQPEPYYPPQKNSMGKWGVIRSPPGLNRQDSTKHDRTALQGQTDRTGQNTTTGKPSRARQTRQDIPQEPEALLG